MQSERLVSARGGDATPIGKANQGEREPISGPLEDLTAKPAPTKESVTLSTTSALSPPMTGTPRHTDYHLLIEARRTGDFSHHSSAIARTAIFSLTNLAQELPPAEIPAFTEALQKYRRDPAFLSWVENLAMNQRLPMNQIRDLLVALPADPQAALSLPEQNRIVGIWERTEEPALRQLLATMGQSPRLDMVRGSIESAIKVKTADAALSRLDPAIFAAAQKLPGSTRISLASIMNGIAIKLPPPVTARIMQALIQSIANKNWVHCLHEIKEALNLPPRETLGDPKAHRDQRALLEYLLNIGRSNYNIPIFHTAICGLNYLYTHRDEVKKYEYIQEFHQSVREGILEPNPDLKFGTPAWEALKQTSHGELRTWLSASEREQANIAPDKRAITYGGPQAADWADHRDAEPIILGLLGELADSRSPRQVFDMQIEFLSYLFTDPNKGQPDIAHNFSSIDQIVSETMISLIGDAPDFIRLLHRAISGGYISRESALTLWLVPENNPDWRSIVTVRQIFANALASFPPDEQARIVTNLRRAQGVEFTTGLLKLVATEARHVTKIPLPDREDPYNSGVDVLFQQYVAPPDRMPSPQPSPPPTT